MLKIFSWNVNGLRAILRKGALKELIESKKPDVFCLQETKISKMEDFPEFSGYRKFVSIAKRKGYSGTAILVKNGIEAEYREVKFEKEFEDKYGKVTDEGRICCVELAECFLVSVYTPNSKDDLSRLKLREGYWDKEFLLAMKKLEKEKPVVFAGDLNAAHEEIDIARPEANHFHAGFTDEERKGVSEIIKAGFVDSFRKMHPETRKYSWWSYRGRARENNVGWRIDYFFVSSEISHALSSAEILDQYMGSDHCPIMIEIEA